MFAELQLHVDLILVNVNEFQDSQAFGKEELQEEASTFSNHCFWIIAEAHGGSEDDIVHEFLITEQGVPSREMTQKIKGKLSDEGPRALQAAEEKHQQGF
jgi:hypothetical protein